MRLTDFRSYDRLDLKFDGRPAALFGPNGAGKTNLLEAISLLSPGRGLRRAKLDALARKDGERCAPAWGINARLSGEDETKIAIGQIPEAPRRRTQRVDGKAATGTVIGGHIAVMWLTPAQDRLFTGPAGERRKFLDRLCLPGFPKHGQMTLRYNKARADRNRLLSDGIDDDLWFDALETDMASCGAQIALARFETLKQLSAQIKSRPETAFPKSTAVIEGEAEALYARGEDSVDVERQITAWLKSDRGLDRRAGRTLRGVHRSDLIVHHSPKSMPAGDCSTGEQKALLIGLILAQARTQSESHPTRPLALLLDEVAAHLDEHRRSALAEELLTLPVHSFMTGTDAGLFEAFGDRAQMIQITDSSAEICS